MSPRATGNLSHFDSELTQQFRCLVEDVASLHSREGVPVKPYRSSDVPLFEALSLDKKQETLAYLKLYSSILDSKVPDPADLKNNARSLWDAIKTLGFRHSSKLFGYLEDDDMIEVYNPQGIQIWRNFNVMRICSYTVEEMYTLEWQQRYYRDEKDTFKIIQAVTDTLSLNDADVLSPRIPFHRVIEKASEHRYILEARHDHFSPLMDDFHQAAAFVVISKVRVIGSTWAHPEGAPVFQAAERLEGLSLSDQPPSPALS